jgi:hypothetical protein
MTTRFNAQIDALLTAIADEGSDAVEQALQIYDVNDIMAVVAKRLLDVEASGGGGSQPVLVATATVTSPQLLTLQSAPVVLVATPGAGKVIVPLTVLAMLGSATTPYVVNGFAGICAGAYTSPWQDLATILVDDPGQSAALGVFPNSISLSSLTNLDFEIDYVDQPLLLADAGDDGVTGGDGTLSLTVYYTVLSGLT